VKRAKIKIDQKTKIYSRKKSRNKLKVAEIKYHIRQIEIYDKRVGHVVARRKLLFPPSSNYLSRSLATQAMTNENASLTL
jgi:hypothetical protein